MPTVTVTGASGSEVVSYLQVTTASTAAIAQSAAGAIGALFGSGFPDDNINDGVIPPSPIVGSLGNIGQSDYGTLIVQNMPNNVVALTINNSGDTFASNSRFNGSETVLAGTGNLNFTDNGASTFIVTGGGNNTITFSATSADGSFLGDGNNVVGVNSTSGITSVFGTGASSDTIYGSATASDGIVYKSASGANAFIDPRSADVTVFGSNGAGSTTVFSGTGANAFTGSLTVVGGHGLFEGGSAGDNLMSSASVGGTTMVGGGSGDMLTSYGPGDLLVAGSGISTLDGSHSSGGDTLIGSSSGASLIYGSATTGDVVYTNGSTVQGVGFEGEFINLHTGPNALLRSLNTSVAGTVVGGAMGGGAQFATMGDFISGLDKLVLVTSVVGASSLSTGTMVVGSGSGAHDLAYSVVTTTNGSQFTFYNTTLTANDIVNK